jgi:transposase
MAGKVLAMENMKEIIRMKALGHSDRMIARALKVSRKTIKKYLGENAAADVVEMDLPQQPPTVACWTGSVAWSDVISEVQKGVPIQILWEELTNQGRISVGYTGFWKQLRRRFPDIESTMCRQFSPGERIEIDYCDGIEIFDRFTGESHPTQLFVGVLCHSRYTFAEFSMTQRSEDFLLSHVRMFDYFGGVAQVVSPDNLRSAVAKAHKYDPVINPAYTRLAEHYEFAVVPARVKRPQDKAIVERTIQIFQRWFFMQIRKMKFYSLQELNRILLEHLVIFNNRLHRILRRSRLQMFEEERGSLIALPEKRYEVATHHRAKLHADCHVVFEKTYYSAPFSLRGEELDLWISAKVIEIYHQGQRVAMHPRKPAYRGVFQTDKRHYPPEHQAYYDATPQYLRDEAVRVGPKTAELVGELLSGPYPLQYVRRCQGIIRLSGKYGPERLETAIERALMYQQKTYQQIERLIRWTSKSIPVTGTPAIIRSENQNLRGQGLFN